MEAAASDKNKYVEPKKVRTDLNFSKKASARGPREKTGDFGIKGWMMGKNATRGFNCDKDRLREVKPSIHSQPDRRTTEQAKEQFGVGRGKEAASENKSRERQRAAEKYAIYIMHKRTAACHQSPSLFWAPPSRQPLSVEARRTERGFQT